MDNCVALILAMFLQGGPSIEFYEKFEPQPSGSISIKVASTCHSVHIQFNGYFCPVGKTQMGNKVVRIATDTNYMRYCYVIEKKPFGVISDGEFKSIIKEK